jgi:hypothetical protein
MRNITVIKENTIHNKWMDIKSLSKKKDIDIEELDDLTQELLAQLGILTEKGYDSVDGVHLDVYKNRCWGVVENLGLLPLINVIEEEEYEDFDYELDYDDEW